MSLADRVVVMDGGRIRQTGTPDEVYNRPADLFVANFVGTPGMNFVRGEIDENGAFRTAASTSPLAISRSLRAGPVVLGTRCEHVHIDHGGALKGQVLVVEFLGSHRCIHIDVLGFGKLIAREAESDAPRQVEDLVRVSLDENHLNFFDPETGARL